MPTSPQSEGSTVILADQPVFKQDDDLFDFANYTNTLVNTIINSETPITFGVFGKWGTGKTSLMRMLYTELRNQETEKKIFPVWFEAWQFENEENLIIALLYTMRDEILHRNPKRLSNNPYEKLFKTLDYLAKALASGVEVSTTVGRTTVSYKADKSITAAKDLAKEYDKAKKLGDAGRSPYYDLFYYLREQVKDLHPLKIIIFVDDLDRCRPSKAISILESMKLAMNTKGIVFVVAAEREILERITEKGKYGEQNLVDGNSFLKKIIQVFFNLPPLTDEVVDKYVKTLMDRSGNLQAISAQARQIIIKMFSTGSGSNPREIKRLINNFSILYGFAPKISKPEVIALMLVIQQRWPIVFQNILSNREAFVNFINWASQNLSKDDIEKASEDWEMYFLSSNKILQKQFLLLGVDLSILDFIFHTQPKIVLTKEELDEYIHFSAIGLMAMIRPDDLRFTQIVESAGGKKKSWTVRADAPDSVLDRIESITYTLPATNYSQHERTVTRQDGFLINDIGITNVTIRIKVLMKNGSVLPYTYYLNLAR